MQESIVSIGFFTEVRSCSLYNWRLTTDCCLLVSPKICPERLTNTPDWSSSMLIVLYFVIECQRSEKTRRQSCHSRFRSFGVDSARTIMCNLISYAFPSLNARVFRTFSCCQRPSYFGCLRCYRKWRHFALLSFFLWWHRRWLYRRTIIARFSSCSLRQSAKHGTRKNRGGAWHQFTPFTEFTLLGYSLMAKRAIKNWSFHDYCFLKQLNLCFIWLAPRNVIFSNVISLKI